MYIEDGVTVRRSTIGPNVSISAGTVIEDSKVRNAIIGAKSKIAHSTLHDSLVGDEVAIDGFHGALTIGDHSELRADS